MKEKLVKYFWIIILLVFLIGCVEEEEPTPKTHEYLTSPVPETLSITATKPADIEWGIGVYPHHGFTNSNMDDWEDAFEMASEIGRIAHLEVTYGEISLDDAMFLYDIKVPLARKHNMEVFMQVNTFGTVPKDMEDFKNYCVELAKKYKPDYMCVGQEINYVYDNNEKDKYDSFVSGLLGIYEEVNKVSPDTECFPSFAYEPLRAKHQEFLFDSFRDHVPYLAITSYPMNFLDLYPGHLYDDPENIAIDYWNCSDITDRDVFVTETGWSTNPYYGGSRGAQSKYVNKVYELAAANPHVKKVVWITLMDVVDENTHDYGHYPGTMGFYTIEGVAKEGEKYI